VRTIRTIAAAVMAAALLAAAAPAVFAAPPADSGVVNRGTSFGGWVYEGSGYYVLSGPPLAQGCYGEGFSEPPAMFISPRNGSSQEKYQWPHEQINVFKATAGMNAFEWLDGACGAVVDGNPATQPPDPVAVGVGRLKLHVRVDTAERVHIQNGVVGKVTTSDGRRVHLSTRAKYIVYPDGSEDLQQLWVKYGG
jgi:hypothetical protein